MHPLSPGAHALREIDVVLHTVQTAVRAALPAVLVSLMAVAVVAALAFQALRLHARRTAAARMLKVVHGVPQRAQRRWRAVLAAAAAAGSLVAPSDAAVASSAVDTIRVAAPTGVIETDRANVQAAFDAVQPGGTVRFAPGMYRLGAGARLTVPDVTVVGHPDGTVLRGCEPEAFDVKSLPEMSVQYACTGLHVQAERQTIRGLTFEYTWHAIVVGPYPSSAEEAAALGPGGPPAFPAGGQRIEGNTFRYSPNGLRVLGTGTDRSVVRDNDFVDVFHAIGIYGAPLHFVDNRIMVEDPARVPFTHHPGSAVLVSPGHTDCSGHVIAGNRIEGYPDAIYVITMRGETCRGVEIRDNTIRVARVRIPAGGLFYAPTADDSTMVGVPITLMNNARMEGMPESDSAGVVEDVVVTGNRILGAEGVGIVVQDVSNSRIEDNVIDSIRRRSPFPGITWDGWPPRWADANGSGIWISPGSTGNEVAGNTFENIAGWAVVVEGDSNRVDVQSPADSVRDVGSGNRSVGAGSRTSATVSDASRVTEPSAAPVAVVRTRTLQWEGEQTYIPLYADGSASGLIVVNFAGGQLFGTTVPDVWSWLDENTVEICGSVNVIRNEVEFPAKERECAPHPIAGKELDLDGDGDIDLIETFTILHPSFYGQRPRN